MFVWMDIYAGWRGDSGAKFGTRICPGNWVECREKREEGKEPEVRSQRPEVRGQQPNGDGGWRGSWQLTIRLSCRGRLQDRDLARNRDGGPGQLQPLVRPCHQSGILQTITVL